MCVVAACRHDRQLLQCRKIFLFFLQRFLCFTVVKEVLLWYFRVGRWQCPIDRLKSVSLIEILATPSIGRMK